MKIEIFWNDLKKEKQKEILEKLGENCNWDIIPMATIEIEDNLDKQEIIGIPCGCGYSCDLCTDYFKCQNPRKSCF